MKPYYEEKGITIYHGDCREILPSLPKVDLVLTDPNYGINWKPRINHQEQFWVDDCVFNPTPFLEVGVERVFWGANYFADKLPPSADWLSWIKRPINFDFSKDQRTYSTVELAWSNLECGARFIVHVWDGGMRAGADQNRSFCHPAQKPLEVMKWVLSFSRTDGIVLDPFMGSGTTLRAAKDLGRKAIGIEIEEKYCEIAANRLRQEVLNFEAVA